MAMRNPYAAYQKFAKKKPLNGENGQPHQVSAAEETAVEPTETPAKEETSPAAAPPVTPLAGVKESFQPQRQKLQNPRLYQMNKHVTLKEEEGANSEPRDSQGLEDGMTEKTLKPADKKPVNPYLQSKVMTATPEELVLMLYDGAIRFMNQAVVQLEAENKPAAHEASIRAQAIVAELMGGLNMDVEISANLMSLYDYLQYVMVNANIHKNVDQSRHAIEMLRELRETWQEAMKLHRASQ